MLVLQEVHSGQIIHFNNAEFRDGQTFLVAIPVLLVVLLRIMTRIRNARELTVSLKNYFRKHMESFRYIHTVPNETIPEGQKYVLRNG